MKPKTDRWSLKGFLFRPVEIFGRRTTLKNVLPVLLSGSLLCGGCTDGALKNHSEKGNKEKKEQSIEEIISDLCENGFYEDEVLFGIMTERSNWDLLKKIAVATLEKEDYELVMQVRSYEGCSKEKGKTDWSRKDDALVLTAMRDVEIPESDIQCHDYIQIASPSTKEPDTYYKVLTDWNEHIMSYTVRLDEEGEEVFEDCFLYRLHPLETLGNFNHLCLEMLTGETLSSYGLLQINAEKLSENEMKPSWHKDREGNLIVTMEIDSSMPEADENFIPAGKSMSYQWQGIVVDGLFTEDHSEGALYYPFGNLSEGYESVSPLEYAIEMKIDEDGVLQNSTLTYSITAGNGDEETVLSQKFITEYFSSKNLVPENAFDTVMTRAVNRMNAALIERYKPEES